MPIVPQLKKNVLLSKVLTCNTGRGLKPGEINSKKVKTKINYKTSIVFYNFTSQL